MTYIHVYVYIDGQEGDAARVCEAREGLSMEGEGARLPHAVLLLPAAAGTSLGI